MTSDQDLAMRRFVLHHLGIDMTALEIARFFGCNPAQIHAIADDLGLESARTSRPTSVFTPYPFAVAVGVRKATWNDSYWPYSMEEFHAIYPDGQRHISFRPGYE